MLASCPTLSVNWPIFSDPHLTRSNVGAAKEREKKDIIVIQIVKHFMFSEFLGKKERSKSVYRIIKLHGNSLRISDVFIYLFFRCSRWVE